MLGHIVMDKLYTAKGTQDLKKYIFSTGNAINIELWINYMTSSNDYLVRTA